MEETQMLTKSWPKLMHFSRMEEETETRHRQDRQKLPIHSCPCNGYEERASSKANSEVQLCEKSSLEVPRNEQGTFYCDELFVFSLVHIPDEVRGLPKLLPITPALIIPSWMVCRTNVTRWHLTTLRNKSSLLPYLWGFILKASSMFLFMINAQIDNKAYRSIHTVLNENKSFTNSFIFLYQFCSYSYRCLWLS